jgi:peroxiredoxin
MSVSSSRSIGALVLAASLGLPAGALAQAPLAPPPAPSVGAVLPEFDAPDVQGKVQRVSFPKGSSTVLLFFLSGCPSCHKMIPEWNRMFERKPKDLRVLGVLMDQEPPGFFSSMAISFPVLRAPGRQTLQTWQVNRAPLTLRVAEGGRIQEVGLGILDPIRLGEMFRP